MEFVIDRSKWLRGKGPTDSYLLRSSDGKMCCLGFFSLACGLTQDQIKDVQAPKQLIGLDSGGHHINLLSRTDGFWLMQSDDNIHTPDTHTPDTCRLMEDNDNRMISEQEREEKITRLFAANGVTVKFVDHAE
jgi:hypothetical protein